MNHEFLRLYKDFYIETTKLKHQKLTLLVNYIEHHYSVEDLFRAVDVGLYCLRHSKMTEAKIVFSTIQENQLFKDNLLLKYYKVYINTGLHLYDAYGHNKLSAAETMRYFKRFKLDSLNLMCSLSLNKNGYLREAALQELKSYPINVTLPYYLIALNDWVEVISKDSKEHILSHLNEQHVEAFLISIEFIDHLNYVNRQQLNCSMVYQKTHELLTTCEIKLLIYIFKKQSEVKSKRLLIEYIVNREEEEVLNFLKTYDDIDDSINCRVISYLENRLSKDLFLGYLKRSESPLAAFTYLNLVKEIELIKPYIFHVSLSVQRFSRIILKNMNHEMTTQDYLNELGKGNNKKRQIITGLIDVCGKEHHEILCNYLNYESKFARKLAFQKLCSLQLIEESTIKEFLIQLPSFTRKMVIRYKLYLDVSYLCQIYQTDNELLKTNLMMIIAHLSKWDALEGLLTILLIEKDKHYRDDILQSIYNWDYHFNKTFPSLTQPQKQTILSLISKVNLNKINAIKFRL